MADFYTEMQAMATGLLSSTSAGGLGQGSINLVKRTIVPPANDWETGTSTTEEILIKAAAKGVSAKLIGVEVGGTVIVESDIEVISAIPAKNYVAGDSMLIDGVAYNILSVQKIPAAGIAAAVKFIVRA